MLEPPVINAEKISACLKTHYGVAIAEVVFLPLGADPDTGVYRAVANDDTAYFVKLRRGVFFAATDERLQASLGITKSTKLRWQRGFSTQRRRERSGAERETVQRKGAKARSTQREPQRNADFVDVIHHKRLYGCKVN